MITLHWYSESFIASKAVKGPDWVALYDDQYKEIQRIIHIYGNEWNHIQLDGEWTDPIDIPSETEILRADMDFITMENEYLTEQNEQQQADIDYCLMLLEE